MVAAEVASLPPALRRHQPAEASCTESSAHRIPRGFDRRATYAQTAQTAEFARPKRSFLHAQQRAARVGPDDGVSTSTSGSG